MKHLLLIIATLLLLGCGDSKGDSEMIVTAVHNNDDITLLSTNATDNNPTAQYKKIDGFWGAGEDYENGTKLKYNGAIYEVEIPNGAVDWQPLTAYGKDTIIKYVEYDKVYYVKALTDIPKGYDFDEPTDSELNTQCIVGARPVSNFTWRYKRRIENFDYTTNNKWFCNGVGGSGSDSYEHEIYTTGGDAPSTKYKITNKGTIDNPKDDVVSDEEIPPVKLGFPNSSYKIQFFIANGDLYEKNMDYDGTYAPINPLDPKYSISIDILDTFYYSPQNQDKIFDNDINSKTVRDNELTFKFEVNASKFYLYGVTGEHLVIKVDGVTKLDKELIYQEHGSTEWVKLGDTNATHTVDVEITADGLECALGDVYINKQKSINLGITDFNVDFSTLDTSKLERKAGGVIDIKEGIKFITAKVTVHNYATKRYTLLKILKNLTAKRYAFDLEDSELQMVRDPESVFIIGRLQTSELKLENKNNKLSELTPLSFTIEEFA